MIRPILLGALLLLGAVPAAADPVLWLNGTAAEQPIAPAIAPPALPLATGTKVVELGEQTVEADRYIYQTGNHGLSNNTNGILMWCRILDPRFNSDSWFDSADPWGRTAGSIFTMSSGEGYNGAGQGVEADTLSGPLASVPATNTPGLIARTRYALTRAPGIVFLEIGDNDVQGGRTATAIEADLDKELSIITSHGVWVILTTLEPAWPTWTAQQVATHDAVNAWIKAQAGRTGVKVADLTGVWTDQSALLVRTINQTGQLYYDELNSVGAYRAAAQVVLPLLQSMVAAGTTFSTDPTASNLLPSYGFTGTTGTKSPTTAGVINGSVPTGWTLSRLTGTSTFTVTQEAMGTTGLNKFDITVTPVNDGTAQHRIRLYQAQFNFSTAGLADGDWVQLVVPIDLDGWAGWISINPKVDMQGTGRVIAAFTATTSYSAVTTGNAKIGTGAWSGYLISEPTQIRAGLGLTSFRTTEFMDIYFDSTATGTGTIKINPPILRKVSDPRTAWNLP